MKKNKYLFVIYVYEYDKGGEFLNSVRVELIDTNIKNAEKRALKLAGNENRNKTYTTVISELKND